MNPILNIYIISVIETFLALFRFPLRKERRCIQIVINWIKPVVKSTNKILSCHQLN